MNKRRGHEVRPARTTENCSKTEARLDFPPLRASNGQEKHELGIGYVWGQLELFIRIYGPYFPTQRLKSDLRLELPNLGYFY